MILAKIVGTVVATRKDPRLAGSKLPVARTIDPPASRNPTTSWRSTPWTPAGETVLVVSGLRPMASGMKDCPVDAAVVGIVDEIEVRGI